MRSRTPSHQSRGGFGEEFPFPPGRNVAVIPHWIGGQALAFLRQRGAECYRCYAALAKPIARYSSDELMEVSSIPTRPATRLVPAVGSRLKQFHKDHYFPFQDVLQPNKILLRSLPCRVAQAAAALMVQLKMN